MKRNKLICKGEYRAHLRSKDRVMTEINGKRAGLRQSCRRCGIVLDVKATERADARLRRRRQRLAFAALAMSWWFLFVYSMLHVGASSSVVGPFPSNDACSAARRNIAGNSFFVDGRWASACWEG